MDNSDLSSSLSDSDLEGLYAGDPSDESDDEAMSSLVNSSIAPSNGPLGSFVDTILKMFGGRKEQVEPKLPFCTMSISSIELDADIANDPYIAGGVDILPTIYSSRPYFFFAASSGRQASICGKGVFVFYEADPGPDPYYSWISVVDVYDKYGLEMAYSYLHKIYHCQLSIKHPAWLAAYLVASLATLRPDFAGLINQAMKSESEQLSLLCCSTLLADLVLLDTQQPRLLCDIEPHTTVLPVEILARIFNSRRISKTIAAELAQQRSCRPLRLGELGARATKGIVIELMEGMLCLAKLEERKIWKLEMIQTTIRCGSIRISCCELSMDIFPKETASMQQLLFSYRDYARIRQTTEAAMFRQMISEVDREDKKIICAWILMLTVDIGLENEEEIPIEKLSETLDNLIEMVEGRFLVEEVIE